MASPRCLITELTQKEIACSCGFHRKIRESDWGTQAGKDFLLDKYIQHRKDKGTWHES